MAELLQPPDPPLSADPPPISVSATSLAPPAPLPPPPPPENLTSAAAHPVTSTSNLAPAPGVAPKRQRRPSVRLGEIGDQSYDHQPQPPLPPPPPPRRPKTWRFHKDPSLAAKTSKTRPLTNLVNGGARRDHIISYGYDFGSKKPKSKKPTKRLRSNWSSSSAAKFDSSANGMLENDAVFRDENLDNHISKDDDVRDELEAEQEEDEEEEEDEGASESPLKEQMSPLHSMDNQNMGLQFWDRRAAMRARQETNQNNNNKESNFDDAMNGIHNEINSGDDNRRGSGVRDWLIGLGLGRYAPVFEIHEVDDEVLPMLTLEDLKDMGINAVGSRRKMYSAILKLRKGFS